MLVSISMGTPAEARAEATPQATDLTGSATILLVEDEESYREALSFMLGKEGFEVVTASDGTQGIALFDAQGADLVLLDLPYLTTDDESRSACSRC